MPIYTIDIPDEAVQFIKTKFGQDVSSFIEEKLIRVLMAHFEEAKKQEEVAKVQDAIDTKVQEVRDQIKLEEKKEVSDLPAEPVDPKPVEKQIDIQGSKV